MSKYLSKEEMESAMKKLSYQGNAAEKLREIRGTQIPNRKPEKGKGATKSEAEPDGSGEHDTILGKPTPGGRWYFDRDMAPEIATETARRKGASVHRDPHKDVGASGHRDAKTFMLDTINRLGREGSKGERDRAFRDFGMRRSKSG